MKIKELMERIGSTETGRTVAYIRDAIEEINVFGESHSKIKRFDIASGQRFYELPNEVLKVLDIRMKNHRNSKGEYRSIPRLLRPHIIKDSDGE